MTVGVRPEDAHAFEELASLHEVEATAVGTFTDSGAFVVTHGEDPVAYLPIEFLHDGCPQLRLESEWTPPVHEPIEFPIADAWEMGDILKRIMARPNVASKEWWVRSYDHEVIAQSVIKPFCGVNMDAPGDAGNRPTTGWNARSGNLKRNRTKVLGYRRIRHGVRLCRRGS